MTDEIITELWNIKDSMANEWGCDVKALVAHLRAKTSEGDKQVVDLRCIDRAGEPSDHPQGLNSPISESE